MKIVFCSNYFSHHQLPLSDALYELTGHSYFFLAHKEMDAERRTLGWGRAWRAHIPALWQIGTFKDS